MSEQEPGAPRPRTRTGLIVTLSVLGAVLVTAAAVTVLKLTGSTTPAPAPTAAGPLDLAVNDAPLPRNAVPVTGSLRDAVEPIRCLHFLDDLEDLGSYLGVPIDCDQPHRVEVTGLFRMTDGWDP